MLDLSKYQSIGEALRDAVDQFAKSASKLPDETDLEPFKPCFVAPLK